MIDQDIIMLACVLQLVKCCNMFSTLCEVKCTTLCHKSFAYFCNFKNESGCTPKTFSTNVHFPIFSVNLDIQIPWGYLFSKSD